MQFDRLREGDLLGPLTTTSPSQKAVRRACLAGSVGLFLGLALVALILYAVL
jgi:hypothetical protein